MKMSKYMKATICGKTHQELLTNAVKGKKTKRGFAKAIERVWRKMCVEMGYNPDIEVFCKKGHDCAEDTWHVCWESMPEELCYGYGFGASNEHFYGENYWSFGLVVCEQW